MPNPGEIYEKDDELFIVERVYEAKENLGGGIFKPITLVKIKCIDPSPCHVPLDIFNEKYEVYDPNKE